MGGNRKKNDKADFYPSVYMFVVTSKEKIFEPDWDLLFPR